MYDVIIIGATAAGMGAAVAAAQKKLNTLVIAKELPQTPSIQKSTFGFVDLHKLAEQFQQIIKQRLVEFEKAEVINLEKNIVSFSAETKSGKFYYGKTILIATNGEDLDFDKLIQKKSNGKIKVDFEQKTSVPGIWAVGQSTWEQSFSTEVLIGEGFKAVECIGRYKE